MGVGAALVGGSIASSLLGARSANRAADAQADAAQASNETQRYIFNRSVQLTEPQREAGQNALALLGSQFGLNQSPALGPMGNRNRVARDGDQFRIQYLGDGGEWNYRPDIQAFDNRQNALARLDEMRPGFETSPGYQFALDEGNRALERQQAARGIRFGGEAAKEAMRYNQGMASQEYGNYINRLGMMAGLGSSATQQQVGAGQNFANQVGVNNAAMGAARASGYQGVNDALQGGVNNLYSIYGMKQAGFF